MSMRVDDLVAKYVELRDKKSAMKKQFDEKMKPLNKAMEQIEAALLKTSIATGIESFKTGSGTAYVATQTSASIADWDSYRDFLDSLPEEERWYYVDKRANKTAIEQYKQDNSDLPPGINWSERRTINVRRS